MREKIVPIEVTPEMMKMLEICKKNKSTGRFSICEDFVR